MTQKLIDSIYEIIQDYHCDDADPMTKKRIEDWIFQFDDEDRVFLLSEFLYLLSQDIYISKEKAKEILWEGICHIAREEKYTTIDSFFRDSKFLLLQPPYKSQGILLALLDEMMTSKIGMGIENCNSLSPKNYIYIDDILATGGSFKSNISKFLNSDNNLEKLVSNQIKIISLFFCTHSWGEYNARFILKNEFTRDGFTNPKLFPIYSIYQIENNLKGHNQKLNLAYPHISLKAKELDEFIFGLELGNWNYDRAYRPVNMPKQEVFFSSPENRIRFESIILNKGMEILNEVKSLESNQRPLGMTNPTNQTLGTGTIFFTWNNISNTCPIVFWWVGHNWKGLFPLNNRGL